MRKIKMKWNETKSIIHNSDTWLYNKWVYRDMNIEIGVLLQSLSYILQIFILYLTWLGYVLEFVLSLTHNYYTLHLSHKLSVSILYGNGDFLIFFLFFTHCSLNVIILSPKIYTEEHL